MAITKTQQATGAGATIELTGVAAGSMLTFEWSIFQAFAGTQGGPPTDTNGTFVLAVAPTGFDYGIGNGVACGIWYQANAASGTHTVTPPATADGLNMSLVEWAGVATSTPLDVTASAQTSDTGTSQATGTTATTAQADELVMIGLGMAAPVGNSDVGFTDPVTGFTTIHKVVDNLTDIGTFHAFKVVSSVGTQAATFNWTHSEANQGRQAVIATFKAAAAGGRTTKNTRAWTHGVNVGMGHRIPV